MDAKQLRTYVVEPTLTFLEPEIPLTLAAIQLIMGTGAQESHLQYIDQLTPGPGPAFGFLQMEAATHDDIWANFLHYNKGLRHKVSLTSLDAMFYIDGAAEMAGNLYYAVAMARCHYRRVREALPMANDIAGMARYWKRYYNTVHGKGTEAEFIKNYEELING
jgi:hypothetical protein